MTTNRAIPNALVDGRARSVEFLPGLPGGLPGIRFADTGYGFSYNPETGAVSPVVPATVNAFGLSLAASALTTELFAENTDAAALSAAQLRASVASGSGYPQTLWQILGGQTYAAGIDQADSNKWKLVITNRVTGIGGVDAMSVSTAGVAKFRPGAAFNLKPVRVAAIRSAAAVGNVGAGEDTLITADLPADSLNAAGASAHIVAWGTTANNANAKTLKLYFGSVAILTYALTVSIAGIWRIEADVVSTGTDAQDVISQLVTTGTAGVALNALGLGSLTQDDGAAITVKCTGTAVADNDIVMEGLVVDVTGA